jgi:hypothetical protein
LAWSCSLLGRKLSCKSLFVGATDLRAARWLALMCFRGSVVMSSNSSEVVLLQRRLVRGHFAEDSLSHKFCVMWNLLLALELKTLLLLAVVTGYVGHCYRDAILDRMRCVVDEGLPRDAQNASGTRIERGEITAGRCVPSAD